MPQWYLVASNPIIVVTYGDGREVKNPRRRVEIVERLQNHVNPKFFSPRCIYDGTVILYSLRELPLVGGDTHTVKYPGCLCLNYLLTCCEHLV
jgi:hypothetical protein